MRQTFLSGLVLDWLLVFLRYSHGELGKHISWEAAIEKLDPEESLVSGPTNTNHAGRSLPHIKHDHQVIHQQQPQRS